MKINEMIQGISSILDSKKIEKGKPAEIDFQEILKDANDKLNDGNPIIGPSCPDSGLMIHSNPVMSASSLNGLLGLEEVTQIRSQGIQAFENTMRILEQYGEAIGNPEISLKKVDPLVRSLSQELENLNGLSEQLSPSDPLKKIMTEAGIISAMEIEKFRRGEYL